MKKRREFLSHLKKASFDDIEKAYLFFRYRYPKLALLIISIASAYYLFTYPPIVQSISQLGTFGYVSIFFFGMLLAVGFTAPFSIGFFITFHPQNILLASLIGGLGSLVADIAIFRFIRLSFADEFERLEEERPIKKMSKIIKHDFGLKASNYLLYFFAGIFIASPLPDEIGIAMLAGLTHIKIKILSLISFILHTTGLFIILFLASL